MSWQVLHALCRPLPSRHDVCCCVQVLSQGFKQHLSWCRGKRQEALDSGGAEGEEGAEDEAGEEEEEGDPQELAAIEASKVDRAPLSFAHMDLWIYSLAIQLGALFMPEAEVHL